MLVGPWEHLLHLGFEPHCPFLRKDEWVDVYGSTYTDLLAITPREGQVFDSDISFRVDIGHPGLPYLRFGEGHMLCLRVRP